jgi:putative transcriptional regulator
MKNKVSKVKLARVQSDLTQAQLAEKAGVTRQTIGLIEAGKFNPSLRLCLAIARSLNKTLDDLFWIEEDENGE